MSTPTNPSFHNTLYVGYWMGYGISGLLNVYAGAGNATYVGANSEGWQLAVSGPTRLDGWHYMVGWVGAGTHPPPQNRSIRSISCRFTGQPHGPSPAHPTLTPALQNCLWGILTFILWLNTFCLNGVLCVMVSGGSPAGVFCACFSGTAASTVCVRVSGRRPCAAARPEEGSGAGRRQGHGQAARRVA